MAVFLVFHFRSVDRIAIGWIDGRPLFDLRYTWVCNQQNHIVMSERPAKRKLSKRQFCKDHVFIYQGESEYIRIAVDDITFLRADRDYCEIHISGHKTIVVSVPMKDVFHDIPSSKFIRISRSIVLNLNFITKIVGNQIELADGTRLLIGRTYREEIFSGFTMIGSRKRMRE